MIRRPNNALTAARVRTEKRPGRHADGNGLYLVVEPAGNKRWIQRLTIRGRRTDLGLGGYPLVSLNEARDVAFANLKLARSGGDPRTEKARNSVPTFAEAVEQVIAIRQSDWRHPKTAKRWEATLKTYAYPFFGNMPIDQVSGADALRALTPIWTLKPETARAVRGHIRDVMDWAIANGYRIDNPAGDPVRLGLRRVRRAKTHFRAIHYSEVPAALRVVRDSKASDASKLSLEFQVLTAARPGEARNAQWSDVALDAGTWVIPPERMKAEREHRVPLSQRARELLGEAEILKDDSGLIFPSRSGRPLSDMTHLKLLRTLGIDCVPHGFRSSFRDWAAEQTDAPQAVMEAALAHGVRNATEAAYFRSDLFERRRQLMDEWAEYLVGSGSPAS